MDSVTITALVGLASTALSGLLTYAVARRKNIAEAHKIDADADITLATGYRDMLAAVIAERDLLQKRNDSMRLDVKVLESRATQLEMELHRAGIILPGITGK